MKLGEQQDTLREIPVIPAKVQRELFTVLMNYPALREDIFRSCLSCFSWQHEEETCGLYKQRPPAKVIVNSCPSYEDIPF